MTTPTTTAAEAPAERLMDGRTRILAELRKVIVGQDDVLDLVLTALFAGGHCLITGVPGLAKTLLVKTLADVLQSWGESESRLAELLADRIDALDRAGNPTIAFQASGIEGLKVRITAKAGDAAAAGALIAGEEARVRAIVGDAIFATDEQTMESVVLDLLRERGLSLAAAESLTGGLAGARLTAVPGASDVFRGAVVSYASEVKFDLLDVPVGPVVSTDAAKAMALGVRKRLGADIGIATTGVAGPAEQEGHPPGTVFLGLAYGDHVEALRVRLPGDRRRVREYAVISVLNLLRLRISGSSRSPELR